MSRYWHNYTQTDPHPLWLISSPFYCRCRIQSVKGPGVTIMAPVYSVCVTIGLNLLFLDELLFLNKVNRLRDTLLMLSEAGIGIHIFWWIQGCISFITWRDLWAMMEESCSAFPTVVIVGHGHIYILFSWICCLVSSARSLNASLTTIVPVPNQLLLFGINGG